MNILIVEDDAIIALMATEALQMSGHVMFGPAFDAAQALSIAAANRIDVAFVDVNLAGHDEGIAIAILLRDNYGIACVFVSGQVAVARANPAAALGLLPKPYSFSDLEKSAQFIAALVAGDHPPPPVMPAALELFHVA